MKVAVVSTNGVDVNEHFGKATRFLIYEIGAAGAKLLSEEKTESLSVGDPDHPFDQDRLSRVIKKIEGCERVYCTKIGDRPAAELKKLGIEPVIYEGPISEIKL